MAFSVLKLKPHDMGWWVQRAYVESWLLQITVDEPVDDAAQAGCKFACTRRGIRSRCSPAELWLVCAS